MHKPGAHKTISSEISKCTSLELIRLSANQLTEPPMDVLKLPNLAWIALSGNPFLDKISSSSSSTNLDTITDPALETGGTILGEGASGVIRKVEWKGKTVAVKKYKGAMTSDGSPLQERNINVVVSSIKSDSLVKVYGQLTDGSLVMEYLEGYKAFGNPPSMDSCSRDVYDKDEDLSVDQAKLMVTNLLGVLKELHHRGITHGDFYGHNILVKEGYVKLSDFGASFFYDRKPDYGRWIEKIEMRAFGHLVEEINMLVERRNPDASILDDLEKLSDACFEYNSFKELHSLWSSP
eukprot:CAMPEP_0118683270 /NCGR_PEP_ID=MMETSP0800-20121206/5947_1 /TAXON_ID=210618 ORGANISM="Striatella unipunctata, Strain CCMP2910" /NCGR_SAMPLE_ID=MMETSP0800 /ASSEMBLY_ACC=CAM_ASM_000638 /LENGTH=292 /DNA_ID=CAMNT_0006579751 /DNA_START=171 /DNA_END=1049 /DNA_ORIENTATION=+